jgi:hypothetical protein
MKTAIGSRATDRSRWQSRSTKSSTNESCLYRKEDEMEMRLHSVIRHLRGATGPFTSQRCRLALMLSGSICSMIRHGGSLLHALQTAAVSLPYQAAPSYHQTLVYRVPLLPDFSYRMWQCCSLASLPSTHYPTPQTTTLTTFLQIPLRNIVCDSGHSISKTRLLAPNFAPAVRTP